MNYAKIYNSLIERAQNRALKGYSERHHIVPKCIGGTDKKSNLVRLTPEEHYVAHQLLVKMHPDVPGLVWAAVRMTHHSTSSRSNNKIYGWLRARHSEHAKTRIGSKNPSYGKNWFHNPETGEVIKTESQNKPDGWVSGRRSVKCKVCGKPTLKLWHRYCEEHRSQGRKNTIQTNSVSETKPKAERLWEQFLESDCTSVTSFAKVIGVSQPGLTKLWSKYIPEYQSKKKQGKSFKKG